MDEENDLDRFTHETAEEARYWFVVSDFADLSLEHGLDKMLQDVLELKAKKVNKMMCPPCTGLCNQGRDCPAREVS